MSSSLDQLHIRWILNKNRRSGNTEFSVDELVLLLKNSRIRWSDLLVAERARLSQAGYRETTILSESKKTTNFNPISSEDKKEIASEIAKGLYMRVDQYAEELMTLDQWKSLSRQQQSLLRPTLFQKVYGMNLVEFGTKIYESL